MNRTNQMLLALDGLSTGDAFGELFFYLSREELVRRINDRSAPPGPWKYTDDTEMALSVVEMLKRQGAIEQDALALSFADRMTVARGYGAGAYELLMGISAGRSWQSLSPGLFGGLGSFGNGAAMRVAPLGAYFAEDGLERVISEATKSAEVTHAHSEGIAGAVAVAVAAALAARVTKRKAPLGLAWLKEVRDSLPKCETRLGVDKAMSLSADTDIVDVALSLGNGSGISAPDTVPLCLWVCAWHSASFEDAMWTTVSALGDRDTTCAIVGGIIAPLLGRSAIPTTWLAAREAPQLA